MSEGKVSYNSRGAQLLRDVAEERNYAPIAAIEAKPEWRELDSRSVDGLEVALIWRASDGAVCLEVADYKQHSFTCVAVDAPDAAYAFKHPFAYAAERTIGELIER